MDRWVDGWVVELVGHNDRQTVIAGYYASK